MPFATMMNVTSWSDYLKVIESGDTGSDQLSSIVRVGQKKSRNVKNAQRPHRAGVLIFLSPVLPVIVIVRMACHIREEKSGWQRLA